MFFLGWRLTRGREYVAAEEGAFAQFCRCLPIALILEQPLYQVTFKLFGFFRVGDLRMGQQRWQSGNTL